MERLPLPGAPVFRFLPDEVIELEVAALQVTGTIFPSSQVIDALTARFNASPHRAGMFTVKRKQVWLWFRNRRYGPRNRELKANRGAPAPRKRVHYESNLQRASSSRLDPSAQAARASLGKGYMDNGNFIGEIMPLWTHVRRRSVPFQPGECVDIKCRDLVLCFQEFEDISLHCEAHVLAITRRHDLEECRCRFLVSFEHDKTQKMVPLEKLRRPPKNFHIPTMADYAGYRVQPSKAFVDLTSNETSKRARQIVPNQYKLMNMMTAEATIVSNSVQEKPANDGVGAIPAASAETCNFSAPAVATSSSAEAAPEIIEVDSD